jgi:dTDP-4-dehydrorhamnose reductase
MKILITGANGQLGTHLQEVLKDYELLLTDLKPTSVQDKLDITDGETVYQYFEENQPEVVINCAAYVNVDEAEKNPDLAYEINRDGAQNVAEASLSVGAKLIHISTDYVFDGESQEPYNENSEVHPLNVYGESKLAGEIVATLANPDVLIVRTAWLYGGYPKLNDKNPKLKLVFKNFVNSILTKAQEGQELTVVDDQVGCPTYAGHLAQAIRDVIEKEIEPGIYHCVNKGSASWFEFAQEILKCADVEAKLVPIKSKDLSQSAQRPAQSILSTEKLADYGIVLPSWQEGLRAYLNQK